jgi:hypothetical protein
MLQALVYISLYKHKVPTPNSSVETRGFYALLNKEGSRAHEHTKTFSVCQEVFTFAIYQLPFPFYRFVPCFAHIF